MIVAANPNNPTRPDLPDGTGFSVLAVLPDGTFDVMLDPPDPIEVLRVQIAEQHAPSVDALRDITDIRDTTPLRSPR